MCCWLDVSRAGYYKWRKQAPSAKAQRREQIKEAVILNFNKFKKRYGAPRLTVELNENGIACSINHVAKLMNEAGLKARNGKNFRYYPNPLQANHVSSNLLCRDFTASRPNEKWVSDITYIKIHRGYVYLAVVMDLFSRQIIGWAMDKTMTTDLIIDAFNMAVAKRKVKPGLILHSDRGVQYRSGHYQRRLLDHQILCSMSRKRNCWDNAAMEAFFARMKVESLHAESFRSLDEAYSAVFEYIELFYNSVRRHSAIGYRSPRDYEEQFGRKYA